MIGRRALLDYDDPRLRVFIVPDLDTFEAVDDIFADVDACFFCVGVSSFGRSETAYRSVTSDLTLNVARELLARGPEMMMVQVWGAGADSASKARLCGPGSAGKPKARWSGFRFGTAQE